MSRLQHPCIDAERPAGHHEGARSDIVVEPRATLTGGVAAGTSMPDEDTAAAGMLGPMHIRPETPNDVAAIRAVNVAAFPTPAEADLVERIRATDAFVPALSLVAELAPSEDAASPELVVGHLMLSRVAIAGLDEQILALAPMAVVPEHQRQGIGSALVTAALDAAEAREEPLVVVLGHPWFYPRFGFKRASRYGLFPSESWPDAAFMAKPLTRWSQELRGRVVYPSAFDGL